MGAKTAISGRKADNSNTGPRWIRTIDQWIMSPLAKIAKALTDNELTEQEQIDFAKSLAKLVQKYPELGQIIERWEELSVEKREEIVRMVRRLGNKIQLSTGTAAAK